jgi:hypothetical protein
LKKGGKGGESQEGKEEVDAFWHWKRDVTIGTAVL